MSLILLFLVYSPALADVSITDASGDAYGASSFSDFLALHIIENDSNLTFKLDFVSLYQGAKGAILLDLDGNRQTHGNASNNITEATIEFDVAILGICTALYFDHEDNSANLNCWVSGNSLFIESPLALITSDVEDLEVAAVASVDFLCEGRDRVPDEGYLRLSNGTVHIDNQGLDFTPLSLLTDPVDAAPPVDLKGMEVSIVGEHLLVRASYHHLIGPHDINAVSVGMISLDADGDILTGFQNASGIFPTFGVDAYIYYTVYPWAVGGNVDVSLTIQDSEQPAETTGVQIGKFSSDSCFFRQGDFVEFSIPLSLLPAITDEAVLLINAMEPIAGLYDSFPDGGAIKLNDGTLKPYHTCSSEEVFVSDPAGDSVALGRDNDDLIELRACSYENGILLSVNYSELQLIGEALTAIRFDIDQNVSTGEHTTNATGDTEIGVEKTFVSQSYTASFTAIMVEGSSGDLLRGIESLYTYSFGSGRMYVTIPQRLLGDYDGMDIQAVTMSGDFGTATLDDEIPDTGVFSLNFTNDTDGDGIPDFWERDYFHDLATASDITDYDHDGLLDKDEYLYRSDPKKSDTDGDGFTDGAEVIAGSNPLDPDSIPQESIVVHLHPGFNLLAIPADVTSSPNLWADWMPVIGDATQIERVMIYDSESEGFLTFIPEEAPTEDYTLIGGEALIVYSKTWKTLTFSSPLCKIPILQHGFNLIGISCSASGYSAFDFLSHYGSGQVSSIQRYAIEKGAFETASFGLDNSLFGIDFPIQPGEGYFVFME